MTGGFIKRARKRPAVRQSECSAAKGTGRRPIVKTHNEYIEQQLENPESAEALELVIESYIDNGRALPEPSLDAQAPEGVRELLVSVDVDSENRLREAPASGRPHSASA